MRNYVVLTINGQRLEIGGAQAFMMMADFLRKDLGLCGTKIVCAEGDCGACTVLCLRPHRMMQARFEPINACIVTVAQLDGAHILTVEALKDKGTLSPVQEALALSHGSQCGYCTPGFAMVLSALVENSTKEFSTQEVKNGLTGNLCRCTGYESIIEAACAIKKDRCSSLLERYYRNQEPEQALATSVHLAYFGHEFYAPTSLEEATAIRKAKPEMRILGAATDLGVLHNKAKITLSHIMSLHLIEKLHEISVAFGRITVGALVSFAELRRFVADKVPEFARFLNIFASPQIKNMATIVGNVANASPIADSLPFLLVADTLVHVRGEKGTREIPITELYLGYKTLALDPSEIITHLSFTFLPPSLQLGLFKVSQRKDLDIATVNAAFLFELKQPLNSNLPTINSAKIAAGGVAATAIRLYKTEAFLKDKVLDQETIDDAAALMLSEIAPLDDLRASADYRRVILEGLLRRFSSEIPREHA